MAKATEAQMEALNKFLAVAQAKVSEHEADQTWRERPSTLSAEFGRKFVKVMKDDQSYPHKTCYCYVDLATGSIYKTSGRHGIQDKIERGNIYAADNGSSGVDWFGAVYIR
jgi:hypothetical protein